MVLFLRHKNLLAIAAVLTLGTGISSNSAATTHADLDAAVQQLRYSDLERDVSRMPNGPERDLFTGIIDNRRGRISESIQVLESVLPTVQSAMPGRMGITLDTLADDYLKSFRYRDASRAYEQLVAKYLDELEPSERQDVQDDAATVKLLNRVPTQRIRWRGAVNVATHKSALGTFDTKLTINGVTAPWILDTGANFSVVSNSFAKRLGITALPGTAQTKGSSGAENAVHVGLLPTIDIGGATLSNVVVLIFPDENLKIQTGEKESYQISGILGYPVFESLGEVTFTRKGEFLAGSSAISGGPFSHMFMYKLAPLLECGVHGKERLFAFDTGASGSTFFVPYYREFTQDFEGMKLARKRTSGAGGEKELSAYVLRTTILAVASRDIVLHDVPVFPKALGNGRDRTYGNLGRDLVAGFESFTLDFGQLRFWLGKPLRNSGRN